VVTEENISKIRHVPVDVILPANRKECAMYRLTMDFEIFGMLVPMDYVTDGASVPRWAWSKYPPVGRYLIAAIGHDWKLDQGHGWKESNEFFDKALDKTGIISRRKFVMNSGVGLNAWYKTTFKGEPK
jgi:hypothetical protein